MDRAGQSTLCSSRSAGAWHRDAIGDDDETTHLIVFQLLESRPAQLITPTSEYVWG
jgi:hypothetical protein